MTEQRILAIETSGRIGRVGLGLNGKVIAVRTLDETRRHARDLMPRCRDLLNTANLKPADLNAIAVSLGPGSYTGLRVGVIAAKAMAFALGCKLIGVPTLEVLARQATVAKLQIDVIADALKGKLYVQRFTRKKIDDQWSAATDLAIVPSSDWLAGLSANVGVTGPGLTAVAQRLPAAIEVADAAQRDPGLETLVTLAHERNSSLDRAGVFSLEPIYLRPSSAEEQLVNVP